MTMPADEVFLGGLDALGAVVADVPDEVWNAPSTCAGWTNLDVLGHVGTAVSMGVSILSGGTPARPAGGAPGAVVPADRVAWWSDLAAQASAALVGVDLDAVIESPFGRRSVRDGLAFPAIDLWVHAWDLAQGSGAAFEIPDPIIEFAHTYLDPFPPEQMRGEGKPFGAAIDLDAGTATEVFVAWTGRRPR